MYWVLSFDVHRQLERDLIVYLFAVNLGCICRSWFLCEQCNHYQHIEYDLLNIHPSSIYHLSCIGLQVGWSLSHCTRWGTHLMDCQLIRRHKQSVNANQPMLQGLCLREETTKHGDFTRSRFKSVTTRPLCHPCVPLIFCLNCVVTPIYDAIYYKMELYSRDILWYFKLHSC